MEHLFNQKLLTQMKIAELWGKCNYSINGISIFIISR